MGSTFVPFECPACGPVLETFPTAEVTCSCQRRCLPPEWLRAQLKRRSLAEARADSRHRSAGQRAAVSQNRPVQPVDSSTGSGSPGGGPLMPTPGVVTSVHGLCTTRFTIVVSP